MTIETDRAAGTSTTPTTVTAAQQLCEYLWHAPPRFRDVSWDCVDQVVRTTVLRTVETFESSQPKGLLLMGPVGTGKTSLLWLIVCKYLESLIAHDARGLERIREDYGESWLTYAASAYCDEVTVLKHDQLIQRLREFRSGGSEYNGSFPQSLRARLVCIDDLGVGYEDQGGWNLSLQEQWFDYRWESGLPLVITTNKGPKEGPNSLRKWPGWARIVDRVADPSFSVAISIPGRSKRTARGESE